MQTCLLSLVDAHRQWFKSRQGLAVTETPREISFCGHAIATRGVMVVDDARRDDRFVDNPLVTGPPNIRFYAGCPVRGAGGYRVGTLCLLDPEPRNFDGDDGAALADLAAMVEDEFHLLTQSTVDELTGVANRRGFNAVAGHLLSLCERTGATAELVFFDLDDFKSVNDSLGHGVGDQLLHHFAGLLTRCFRSADLVARLGGDEFVVLLVGQVTDADEALTRLRAEVDGEACEKRRRLRWSAGHVRYDPARHAGVEELLDDADVLMYRNKPNRQRG